MATTTTARAIISAATQALGVTQPGETVDTDNETAALALFNQWIDAAQLSDLLSLVNERTVYSLVANQGTYTFGPGGDFDTGATVVRPSSVEGMGLVLNTAAPYPVETPLAPMTNDQYQGLSIKTYVNPLPVSFYFNPTMPLATVILWPTPTTAVNDLAIYTQLVTAQFATVTTSVTLPPGYARMFRANLALELAPLYGATPSAFLVQQAAESLAAVKAANLPMTDLSMDRALWSTNRPTYNIWSNQG